MDDEQFAVVSEELRVAVEELRAQRELIESLVQGRLAEHLASSRLVSAIPVPIAETDPSGTVLHANPAAAALLRVDAGRLQGKPLLAFIQPDDRRRVRTALSRVAAGGEGQEVVMLAPRRETAVPVRLALVPVDAGPSSEGRPVPAVRWMLAPLATGGVDTLVALAELATLPVVTGDLRTVLERAAALAVRGVGPAVAAGVTVGPPAAPELLATTDERAQVADGLQFRAGTGPIWTAYGTAATVTTPDLRSGNPWADPLPEELSGVVAAPLLDGTVPIGVLALYGSAKLDAAEYAAQVPLFAAGAAATVREHRAVADLRRVERQLREALTSRAGIDQAKGIIMARQGVDAETAFAELTRRSQLSNVKLRDVARQLVDEVSAPGGAPSDRPAPRPAAGSPPARTPRPGPPRTPPA